MSPFPMTSDFAARLAGGLATSVLLLPRGLVPLAFLRTLLLVVMGALVGMCLTMVQAAPGSILSWGIAAAFFAYLASATWGLGLPRVALPMTVATAIVTFGILGWASFLPFAFPRPGSSWFDFQSRLASSALLGTSLAAMLLGHHYLTSPSMSIDPLRRLVFWMGIALAIRTVYAALGLAFWFQSRESSPSVSPLFLGMRWGMGILGPALATALSWQTVRIRSTQSATGILYIGITLVLFGELAGLILGRDVGIEF